MTTAQLDQDVSVTAESYLDISKMSMQTIFFLNLYLFKIRQYLFVPREIVQQLNWSKKECKYIDANIYKINKI